jgi:hypothetical protein
MARSAYVAVRYAIRRFRQSRSPEQWTVGSEQSAVKSESRVVRDKRDSESLETRGQLWCGSGGPRHNLSRGSTTNNLSPNCLSVDSSQTIGQLLIQFVQFDSIESLERRRCSGSKLTFTHSVFVPLIQDVDVINFQEGFALFWTHVTNPPCSTVPVESWLAF